MRLHWRPSSPTAWPEAHSIPCMHAAWSCNIEPSREPGTHTCARAAVYSCAGTAVWPCMRMVPIVRQAGGWAFNGAPLPPPSAVSVPILFSRYGRPCIQHQLDPVAACNNTCVQLPTVSRAMGSAGGACLATACRALWACYYAHGHAAAATEPRYSGESAWQRAPPLEAPALHKMQCHKSPSALLALCLGGLMLCLT